MRQIVTYTLAVAATLGLSTAWAGTSAADSRYNSARHHTGSLNMVGYSTPGPVYGSSSTPGTLEYAFARTKAGKGITFNNSFAASDSQANAVINGQPADVVNFSYAPNMTALASKKLVPGTWWKNKYNGDVTRSVVAFGVRPGNPRAVNGWAGLIKGHVQIVTPSTASSGSAKWNILGAYAYASAGGKHSSTGVKYLRNLKKNIVDEPASGSKAVAAFLAGTGDVVIGYQDDLLATAKANPGKIHVVTPAQSLLIENPIAVTLSPAQHNATSSKAFLNFLYGNAAQTIWARHYYWPVLPGVYRRYKNTWRRPKTVYAVKQFGGWAKLDHQFFGTPNGIWTKIENGG